LNPLEERQPDDVRRHAANFFKLCSVR
jgi:hypothetical protein